MALRSHWVPSRMDDIADSTATTSTTTGTGRPLAAVTGASSGIGLELARQFAEHGYDLVVNAEDVELEAAAASLRTHGGEVRAVRADLRDPSGVEQLHAAIREDARPLAAIALNAGVGKGGGFLDNELADERSVIDLNVTSTVHLAKLVLRDMVAAGSGRVLFTSSVASEMPGAYQAVYNASKSFVQSFAQALQAELADVDADVTVTSLMPGPTDTEFFERAGLLDTTIGQSSKDDPATVARQGFEALMAGDPRVTGGGLKTRVQDVASKVVPDRAKAVLHRTMARPGSGD